MASSRDGSAFLHHGNEGFYKAEEYTENSVKQIDG
jgi:hypothetical protein